jgi:hypothetical protein
MKKCSIIILLSLFFPPDPAGAVDPASLVRRAGEYGRELSRIEASGKTVSLEEMLQQGNEIAAELKPVIERFSPEDYASVEKNMKGYVVNREEVILVEPDTRFFSKLAGKIGTAHDQLYFNYLLKVMPDGFWPVYITRQTDVGGCIDYGNGSLSTLYKEGTGIAPKLAGYYREQIDRTLEDIAEQLTAGACACGTIASVKIELQAFLDMNPKASIVEKVRARMDSLQRKSHRVRENCIGGNVKSGSEEKTREKNTKTKDPMRSADFLQSALAQAPHIGPLEIFTVLLNVL